MLVRTNAGAVNGLQWGSQRKIDQTKNGNRWIAYVTTHSTAHPQEGSTGTFLDYSVLPKGATQWTNFYIKLGTGISMTGISSSFFIDDEDNAHIVYKSSNTSHITYQRGVPNADRTAYTWFNQSSVSSVTNYYEPDLVAHKHGTGWKIHVVLARRFNQVCDVLYFQGTINSSGVISWGAVEVNLHSHAGMENHHPSIDFEHNGNGKTPVAGTPRLFVGWCCDNAAAGRGLRFRQAQWSSGSANWTWGADNSLNENRPNNTALGVNCFYDGVRPVVAGIWLVSNGIYWEAYEWNKDNQAQITPRYIHSTPGVIDYTDLLLYGNCTYDSEGNIYWAGAYQTAPQPYMHAWRRWVRATNTLEAIVMTGMLAGGSGHASLKRHGEDGIDLVSTENDSTPSTISHEIIVGGNTPPQAPEAVDPDDGAVLTLGEDVFLNWVPIDAESGSVQSAASIWRKRIF